MAKDLLNKKHLVRVLDALVTTPRWGKALAAIRASESTAFVWRTGSIKAMKENDTSSTFWIEWRGTYDWWHNHAGRARTESIILHEATIRDQSLNGIPQIVRDSTQRIIYEEREEFIGRSDDYVMIVENCAPDEVARARLKLDADGNPIPQVRIEQVPAAIRLRVLEQDQRYVARSQTEVHHSGGVMVAKAPERLPSDGPPPNLERLRALTALTPEQRREKLGASAVPLDANGRRTIVTGQPSGRDDNLPEIEKPDTPIRASYARPVR